jgi:FlaG/FlaF family flagellin (archaellin)
MEAHMEDGGRGVTPVVGILMLVSVTVILGAGVGAYAYDLGPGGQSPAPGVQLSHEVVSDGSDEVVAVTLTAGDSVRTDRLYVGASKELDIGGPPGSATPANEAHASELETFTESSGSNPPQVDIGETWDAGETVYLDPVGDAEGVTIRLYWNTEPVEGVNPGTVRGDDSYRIATFTV